MTPIWAELLGVLLPYLLVALVGFFQWGLSWD